MRLIISIFFLLLSSIQNIWAVRAYTRPITISEPNGRKLTILLHGDEFFHYMTTLDGKIIAQNREGYFHYADYVDGKIKISSEPVSSSSLFSFDSFNPFVPLENAESVPKESIKMIKNANLQNKISSDGIAYPRLFSSKPVRILVIPVEFSDLKFTIDNPGEHFDKMINEPGYSEFGATGSVQDYLKANIPDLELVFDIFPIVTLPDSYSYYGNNDEDTPSVLIYDKNLHRLVKDVCQEIDYYTDFSEYDNDNDGKIDYIFVIFAGHNEAESGLKETIWPQTCNLSNYNYHFDGKTVSVFSCTSELSGSEEAIPAGIGTFCHETSHFLGLKDLYDTDYLKSGLCKCLWKNLSVMDAGNYNNNGRTPPYYCAIDRELLGRINYKTAEIDSLIELEPIDRNSEAIMINTVNENEYFLIENRAESGWDNYIGGSGMVIYHIDKSLNNINGIQANVRWDNNMINTFSGHECADLVEAFSDAINIAQVFFPGQARITEFSPISNPPFIDWEGNPVGYKITNINKIGENIIFQLKSDSTEVLLTPLNCRVKPYQRRAVVEWDCERNGNYMWGIEWMRNVPDADTNKSKTTAQRFVIRDLEPKENYFCEIYHKGNHSNGDTVKIKFSTKAITSPYPRIEKTSDKYYAGDKIHLIVENLSEETNSIIWYVNGVRTFTDNYKFRRAGDYRIKAVVTYASDNSKEVLIKNITVTNPEDEK